VVVRSLFGTFLSALNGTALEVTKENIAGLSALCLEFGFNFATPLFRRSRISRLEAEVVKLQSAPEAVQTHLTEIETRQVCWESMTTSVTRLCSEVSLLKASTPGCPRFFARCLGLSGDLRSVQRETALASVAGQPRWFRGSRLSPPLRRPRQHSDWVFDTEGNLFGGFTPVEWESHKWNRKHGKENRFKADAGLRSCVFTPKSLHNIRMRRFALKAEKECSDCV
jgi:hypothetical protein